MELITFNDVSSHAIAELYQALSKLLNGGSNFVFPVKRITFFDDEVYILMQMSYGPCPLVSIVNSLILKGKLVLPKGKEFIEFPEVLELILNYVLELQREILLNPQTQLDAKFQIYETAKLLPTMLNGLDVNCGFLEPHAFQFSMGVFLFEICQLELVHGWLISPSDSLGSIIKDDMYYNELTDIIIDSFNQYEDEYVSNKESIEDKRMEDPYIFNEELTTMGDLQGQHSQSSKGTNSPNAYSSPTFTPEAKKFSKEDAIRIQEFLEDTNTQLTDYGIIKLKEIIRENQVAVLFRNNHFNTIYKKNGSLYLLANDHALYQYPNIVWENLLNIKGDNVFCDSYFAPSLTDSNRPITHSMNSNHRPAMYNVVQPKSAQSKKSKKKKGCNVM